MSENYEDDIGDLVDRMSELTDADAAQRAEALRQGLADYDLDDEDISLLESHLGDTDEVIELPALPVLAIVGRPNVGKSALVNRILGRREAVVEDVPGVTRDRVTYKAEWNDRKFTLVDTGGWEPDARGIDKSVALQAEIAVELADAVLFVVDAMVGATATDERVVTMLRASPPCGCRSRRPCGAVCRPPLAAAWPPPPRGRPGGGCRLPICSGDPAGPGPAGRALLKRGDWQSPGRPAAGSGPPWP